MNFSGILILMFVLLPLFAVALFIYSKLRPRRKKEKGFEFVFVEKDGSVRELNYNEIEFLNRAFYPGETARPVIRKTFEQPGGGRDISGFILRKRVPQKIIIQKKGSGPVNLN